ncbi:MAG: hypothetical protein SOW21_05515 [[Actinobacillus] rossii]|nr:hypothetical protein [[Actinobacillus] rossii]MDY3123827.1 hypothetical protein [[Actinobacillus] rossii]MDY4506298.1 hypothetical protein [[Actinobacillus] rossii]
MNNELNKKHTSPKEKIGKFALSLGKYMFASALFMLALFLLAAISMELGVDLSEINVHLQQHWLFWSVIRWGIYGFGAWFIYKLAKRSDNEADKRALWRVLKIYACCLGLFEIMKLTV